MVYLEIILFAFLFISFAFLIQPCWSINIFFIPFNRCIIFHCLPVSQLIIILITFRLFSIFWTSGDILEHPWPPVTMSKGGNLDIKSLEHWAYPSSRSYCVITLQWLCQFTLRPTVCRHSPLVNVMSILGNFIFFIRHQCLPIWVHLYAVEV